MIKGKLIKDPIYGYISIPENLVDNIIDTDIFQRLRRIIQTSYAPLYPSSIHNRFSHSLGVYYLGKIASDALMTSILKYYPREKKLWERKKEIFELACLLHDVGHAPFSHTGETFFLDKGYGEQNDSKRYAKLHNKLCIAINSKKFEDDIPNESAAAAPHEIMSALIGIKCFSEHLHSSEEKEFFARCITGYRYSDDTNKNSIDNCFISLLNSKVIDVDRLDYLIRDAYFTGFETINIDYIRLLNAVTIVNTSKNTGQVKYEVGYHKTAISVIENVVYAHDAERKWIQTHPTIQYDIYIIQHIIDQLEKKYQKDGINLFSEESLSTKGVLLPTGDKISLLCDDDIVHLMKSKLTDDMCLEFFSRKNRRHPVWKSEAEYKVCLPLQYQGRAFDRLKSAFVETEKYLRKSSDVWHINQDFVESIEQELEKISKDNSTLVDEITKKIQKESKEKILKLLKSIKSYSEKSQCEFDFVLLKASQFYSTFNKEEFSKIPIVFSDEINADSHLFKEVVTSLNSEQSFDKTEFFYLFYKDNEENKFNKEKFCSTIYKAFLS